MGRALILISTAAERAKAAQWVAKAPWNTRITFQGPRRSLDQNSTLWLWLTAVAEKLEWHGQKYSPEDWKDFFMHALRKARWMPSEEGGMVPIGLRSSDLSKEEMSDLIELIIAFAARHGVLLPERTEEFA